MSEQQAMGVRVGRDDGEALWWGDGLAVLKVTGQETGGRLSLIEITEPPHYEAPLHVHHNEDEGFWVLEGDIEIEVGGERSAVGPGEFAMGPRGVPHRYTVGPHGCRLLFILTPGGFEDVVRAMGVPARARTLPVETQRPVDPEHAIAIAAAHGVAMVDG